VALDGPFGDWVATKKGMLGTLLAVIESGEIAHARTRAALLEAIATTLDAGQLVSDIRSDTPPKTSPTASSACSRWPRAGRTKTRPAAFSSS
jgi:hypothetical protein